MQDIRQDLKHEFRLEIIGEVIRTIKQALSDDCKEKTN
jgi:hypothetical protein